MLTARHPEQALLQFQYSVKNFLVQRPLLSRKDADNPERLIDRTLEEVDEFTKAFLKFNAVPSMLNLLSTLDEIHDSGVFGISYGLYASRQVEIGSRLGRMNGQGGRSNSIELLTTLVHESAADISQLPWFFAQVQSIITHGLAIKDGNFFPRFHDTVRKAEANRQPPGYEIYDVLTGKKLSDSEREEKHEFTEKFYRLLRKRLGNPLRSQMTRKYQGVLLHWRMGDSMLAKLEHSLQIDTKVNNSSHPGIRIF